jgi:hypothetical protein
VTLSPFRKQWYRTNWNDIAQSLLAEDKGSAALDSRPASREPGFGLSAEKVLAFQRQWSAQPSR